MPIFIDSETTGLHSVVVLIQWAEDDGEIHLFSPWTEPVKESIDLIEKFVNHEDGLVFFNATFDWFHLFKWFTICKQLMEIEGPECYPEDHIPLIIELEELGRDYPEVIKPKKILDLFLHARKTSYQSTMERKNILLKKIPSQLAWMLADELERRVPLKDIYFARRKVKGEPKWQIQDRFDTFGAVDPDWKNIIVRFKPSSALKALAVDIGLATEEQILRYGDISPRLYPVEFGYAPFAKAAMRIKLKNASKERNRRLKYKNTWPDFIKDHITHWGYNATARKYASDDIVYTRGLYNYFNKPPMNDDDSVLSVAIACARWRGYRVDLEGIKELKKRAQAKKFITIIDRHGQEETMPIPTAPNQVKRYILEVCDENEKLGILEDGTAKITLEGIAKQWKLPCPDCCDEYGDIKLAKQDGKKCKTCNDKASIPHPVAIRAKQILDSRQASKEIELYDKLLAAGRLHASFKVIGALSGRMSGADGLNPQGIKKTTEVKSNFLFTWGDEILCGGDYSSYEITIAEAIYNDPDLRKDLLTCEKCEGEMIFDQKIVNFRCTKCEAVATGKKIHALFGMFVYPGMSYEEIKATDGSIDDRYTRCKQAVFLLMYGGDENTMAERLGVPIEIGAEAKRKFTRKYKGIARAQDKVTNDLASMKQPNGRGTKVEWHDPVEYVETLFGFKRYFSLENRICKALFDLASNMPKALKEMKLKVTRTDRIQTAGGATCSAIYSAAFNIQSHNRRAGINHVIQGSGAQGTKAVQRRIWDLQPPGVHKWLVQPMNIHDSIMTPVAPEMVEKVREVVHDTVESIRPAIPLINLPWESYLVNWADKGQGICSYDLTSGEIVQGYKNRFKLGLKDGIELDFNEVYQVLTKKSPSYNGLGWRLLTKDEIKKLKSEGLLK